MIQIQKYRADPLLSIPYFDNIRTCHHVKSENILNLSDFFHNVNWVDDLQNIFKEKCTPALKCECKVNSKECINCCKCNN